MNENVRLCRDCEHFIEEGPMWWSQYCAALDPKEVTNYQTGEVKEAQPYARDINPNGKCLLFCAD